MCTCVCVCVLCVCVCFSWLCPWRSCCMKGPRVCVWVWVCVQCVFVYGYFRYAFGPAYGVAAVGRGQNWLDPSLRPTHHFNRALTVGRHKLDTFVCWYVCRDSYVWHVTHWYIWYCVLAPPASRPQCHLLLLGGGGGLLACVRLNQPHTAQTDVAIMEANIDHSVVEPSIQITFTISFTRKASATPSYRGVFNCPSSPRVRFSEDGAGGNNCVQRKKGKKKTCSYSRVPGSRNHGFWPSQRVSKHTLMKLQTQPASVVSINH